MFYVLSRILACTASPWLYIMILLVAGCFINKRKAKVVCLSLSLLLFLFFSNRVIYQACLQSYTFPYISRFDSIGHYNREGLRGMIITENALNMDLLWTEWWMRWSFTNWEKWRSWFLRVTGPRHIQAT